MKKQVRNSVMVIVIALCMTASIFSFGAQSSPLQTELAVESIKYIGTDADKAKTVYALIDKKDSVYMLSNESVGVYFEQESDIVLVTIDGVSLSTSAEVSFMYGNNGKLEWEGTRYPLVPGSNTIVLRKVTAAYIVMTVTGAAKIRNLSFYGMPRADDIQKLRFSVSGTMTGNLDKLTDGNVKTTVDLHKYFVAPNILRIDAEGSIQAVKLWGKVGALLRIVSIAQDGTKKMLLEGINGAAFPANTFTTIMLPQSTTTARILSIEVQFYDFVKSKVTLGEMEIWGQGRRESYRMNAILGKDSKAASYAVDGFYLTDVHDIDRVNVDITTVNDTWVYVNCINFGTIKGGITTRLAIPSYCLKEGFNLIEYMGSGTMGIVSSTIAVIGANGKLSYIGSAQLLNDGAITDYTVKKNWYMLLTNPSAIAYVRLYYSAKTASPIQLELDGKGIYKGSLPAAVAGYIDIAVTGNTSKNISKGLILRLSTTAAIAEIEVYGSMLNRSGFASSYDPDDDGEEEDDEESEKNTNEKKLLTYQQLENLRKAQITKELKNNPQSSSFFFIDEKVCAKLYKELAEEEDDDEGEGSESAYGYFKDILEILKESKSLQAYFIGLKAAKHITFAVFEKYIQGTLLDLLKSGNHPERFVLTTVLDGTVRETYRELALVNEGNAYDHLEYNGKNYQFVNGVADIPLTLQPGFTTIQTTTIDILSKAEQRWVSIEYEPAAIGVQGKPWLSKEGNEYYLEFAPFGDTTYFKVFNGSEYIYTEYAKVAYILDNKQLTVAIYCYDRAGNVVRYKESLEVEEELPVIDSLTYTAMWTNAPLDVNIQAHDSKSGIARIGIYEKTVMLKQVLYDGLSSIDTVITIPWLGDGVHTVIIRVFDRCGNMTEKTIRILYDASSPVIDIGEAEQFTNADVYNFTFTIKEYSIAKVKINGVALPLASIVTNAVVDTDGMLDGKGSFVTYQCKGSIATQGEGSYAVAILVEDKAGNTASNGFTVIKDMTAPVITVYNNEEAYKDQVIDLKGEIEDIYPQQLTVNGEAATIYKENGKWLFTKQITFSVVGVNSFILIAKDKSGNSATTTWEGIWDTEAPGAVLDLAVSYTGDSTILTWTKPSDDTRYYTITRELRFYHVNGSILKIMETNLTSKKEEYIDDDGQLPIVEDTAFIVGYYRVSAVDRAGNVSLPVGILNKTVATIPAEGISIPSHIDDSVSLIVPANAVAENVVVAIGVEESKTNQPFALNISLEPEGAEFNEFVALEIDLKKQQTNNPEVMLEELDRNNLTLYYFDEEYGQWVQEFGWYRVLPDGREVFEAQIQHFSDYSISMPDYTPQIKKGIVSSNSYFQNNNEYVDEGSGTVYVQRQEAVIQSGNNLSFTLTGLYSSGGVGVGLAPVNHYFGYMIPYIKNGFLYLENGGRYRMIWNAKGVCYYNEELYFEGRYNKDKKTITIYFKDGKQYVFDATGYFKKEPVTVNSLKSIMSSITTRGGVNGVYNGGGAIERAQGESAKMRERPDHREPHEPSDKPILTPPDPNMFHVNKVVPLTYITDRTGYNYISFIYNANTVTKSYSGTQPTQNHTSYILKEIQVYCNTLTRTEPIKKYRVTHSNSKTIYSYFMGEYDGRKYYYTVSTNTITEIIEKDGIESIPVVEVATKNMYDVLLLKERRLVSMVSFFADKSKTILQKVAITNDEGGKTEYIFSNEDFGAAGTRDVVKEKKSYTTDNTVLSRIAFEYVRSAHASLGAYVGCTIGYYNAANLLVKKVYKEMHDAVNKRIISDEKNNQLTEEVILKGKGVNAYYSVPKNTMVSGIGDYYSLENGVMNRQHISMFDSLMYMKSIGIFKGYSIAKSGSTVVIAQEGTKNRILLNDASITYVYEHIIYEPNIDPGDWESKGRRPDGTRIIGRTMVSKVHSSLILYEGKETIGQNDFKVRVIIEVIADKCVVFSEYVPIEYREFELSVSYTGNIEHILEYDLVDSKKLISSEDYDYDEFGNMVKHQKNNIITGYQYVVQDDFAQKLVKDNPSLFIYPQAIWRYTVGGTTKTAVAYDFDITKGVPTAVYDLGNLPIENEPSQYDLTDPLIVEGLKQKTQRVTRYTYDDAGRVTAVVNPDKGTLAYTYPANYHRPETITQKTANGTVLTTMTMTYAVLGDRLLSTTKGNDPSITTDDYTTRFTYYKDGDIKEITNDALMYLTDDTTLENREMKVRYLFGANAVGYIRYAESGSGSLESDLTALNTTFEATFATPQPSDTLPQAFAAFLQGKDKDIAEALYYTFDGLGHIVGITQYNYEQKDITNAQMVWKPYTIAITYDSVGNRTAISFPSKKELLREFDALGRIVAVAIKGYATEASSTNPPLVTKQLYSISYAWKLIGTDLRYVSTYTQQPYSSADTDKYTIVNYQDNNGYPRLFERYKGTALLTHKINTYNPDMQLIQESELADFVPAVPVEIRYSYTAFNELFETILQESEYREPNIATITGSTLDSSFTTSFTAQKRLENTYNNLGQPIQQTQDIRMNGSDTKFGITLTYDEFGNPIKKTYPDSSYETVGYDSSGNAVLATDVDKQTSYVLYDKAGRIYAKRNKNEQSWTYILYGLRGPAAEVTKEGLIIGTGDLYEPLTVENRYKKGTGDVTLHPTLWQSNSTRYYYDHLGRVHKVVDKKGNIVNYLYDDDGKIIKQTYTWKEGSSSATIDTQKVTYSLLGEVLSTTDKNGVTTSVRYDTWRRVYQELVTNNLGNDTRIVREYAYTPHGLVSTVYTYEDGKKVQIASYTYDGLGRVLTQTDEFGVTTSLEYNPDGSVKKLLKEGNSEKIVSSLTYDRLGNTTSLTNGTVTTYTEQGFLTDPVSGKSLFASAEVFPYDTIDKVPPDALYNGVQVTYYKNAKEMLYTKKADGSIALLDIQHNVSAGTTKTTVMMTHLFKTIEIYRNFLNNPSGITPKTNSYEYMKTVFDPYGLVLSSENNEAMKSEFSYNDYYELTAKKDTVLGETFTHNYIWDSTGMLAYKSLPKTAAVSDTDYVEYKYDAKKNLNGVTGVINTVSYNSFMQVAGIEYANTITETFGYDSRFRLSEQRMKINAKDIYSALYSYEKGKIRTIKEYAGSAITALDKQLAYAAKEYSYTGLGRLKSAEYTMPVMQKKEMQAGTIDKKMQYLSNDYYPAVPKEDNNAHFSGGNVTVPYDDADAVAPPTWGIDDTMKQDSSGTPVLNTTWATDAGNNSLVATLGTGTMKGVKEIGLALQGAAPDMTTEQWDAVVKKLDERLFSVFIQETPTSVWRKVLRDDPDYSYQWIVEKGMLRIRFNVKVDIYRMKLHYLGDIKKVVYETKQVPIPDKPSEVDISLFVSTDTADARVFPTGKGYVVVASEHIELAYEYDTNGNMVKETRKYADGTVQVKNFTYSSATNRLKTDDEKIYLYDILGNQIGTRSINGTTSEEFTYNLKGKLVEYTAKQGLTEIVAKGIYKYDALGNRVYREVISKDDSGAYLMVYDEKGMKTYEKQTRGTTSDEFYFIGLTLLPIVSVKGRKFTKKIKYTDDGQSIGVIETIDTAASEFRYYNYLSTLRFTADGTGRITGTYDSLPYGEEAYSFDTESSMNKSTIFATHEKDTESGLYYARNRMYDSASGRFTSVDPIKDGLNWFLYCDADPVNRVDVFGLEDAPGSIPMHSDGGWGEFIEYFENFEELFKNAATEAVKSMVVEFVSVILVSEAVKLCLSDPTLSLETALKSVIATNFIDNPSKLSVFVKKDTFTTSDKYPLKDYLTGLDKTEIDYKRIIFDKLAGKSATAADKIKKGNKLEDSERKALVNALYFIVTSSLFFDYNSISVAVKNAQNSNIPDKAFIEALLQLDKYFDALEKRYSKKYFYYRFFTNYTIGIKEIFNFIDNVTGLNEGREPGEHDDSDDEDDSSTSSQNSNDQQDEISDTTSKPSDDDIVWTRPEIRNGEKVIVTYRWDNAQDPTAEVSIREIPVGVGGGGGGHFDHYLAT